MVAIALGLLLLGALGVAVYLPGLDGVFYFDSVERILRAPALQMQELDARSLLAAAYAGESGYPERGLAHVSFALNHYLSGGRFSPFALKLTNVLIHVANGALLFVLLRAVLGRWRPSGTAGTAASLLALLVTALWVLHPIQLTSVLYAVQRMTSLSATFVLLGLVLYLSGRRRLATRPAAALTLMGASVVVGAGIGFFAKQNALLMPLLALVLEWFCFDRDTLARGARRALVAFHLLTVAAPAAAAAVWLALHPEWVLSGYQARDFDLVQRLLTQPRVLVLYLELLLLPIPSSFSLYHDDIAVSTGLLSPPSTAACLALWLGVLAALPAGWRSRAPWAFGVSWFLAGHALESSFLALEMAHEHRNYLPSAGIVAAAGHYLARGLGAIPRVPAAPTLALLAACLAAITMGRAADWRSPGRLTARLAATHPGSYRALTAWVANTPDMARELRVDTLARAAVLRPDAIDPLLELGRALQPPHAAVDAPLARAIARAAGGDADELTRAGAQRASRLLADEITRRIGRFALDTESTVSLVALTDCVIGDEPRCRLWAEHAERWIDSAIARERTTAVNMTALHLSAAKLRAAAGDVDGAVRHARAVARWTPESAGYRLLEAELYARLGRVEDTRAVLDAIERALGERVRSRARFESLRRYEQRVRANSGR